MLRICMLHACTMHAVCSYVLTLRGIVSLSYMTFHNRIVSHMTTAALGRLSYPAVWMMERMVSIS